MIKSNKLILILSLAIALVLGIVLVTPSPLVAQASIDYTDYIVIEKSASGYLYGNGETFEESDSLQAIFESLKTKINQNGDIKIQFKGEPEVADTISLDCTQRVVINGSARYVGESGSTFITLASGSLSLQGADLYSTYANVITVEAGAKLDFVSGSLTIDGGVTGMRSTLINEGETTIMSGQIYYNSTTNQNAGQAILQKGSTSTLLVEESTPGSIIISGKNALRVSGGAVTIESGTFKATHKDSTENGSAIKVTNDGKVTINGGKFESVEPERTIYLAGNGNSTMTYSGGAVEGKILLAEGASGSHTKLTFDGRKIVSSVYGKVYLFSDSEEMTITTAKMGLLSTGGYYLTGWNNGSQVNPLVSSFESGTTIIATASNDYVIRLIVGEDIKEINLSYGDEIVPSDYGVVAPQGYFIKGWEKGGILYSEPLKVTENGDFNGVLELKAPQFSSVLEVVKSYDGNPTTRTLDVEEVSGLTYTYLWQKKNSTNEWVEYFSGKTISYVNVSETGTYRAKVTVSDGTMQKESYGNAFRVEINKGSYTSISHEPISGVYDATKKLSEYPLVAGFSWISPNTIPTVPIKEYPAVYCLDGENYNELYLNITLDLEKGPAQAETHSIRANNYEYCAEKTLLDYPFTSSSWRWIDESIVPQVGTNSYGAHYNPDRENYNDYETTVELVIIKASYVDIPDLKLEFKYESDLTVRKIILNHGDLLGEYTFAPSVPRLEVLGETRDFIFPAIYNADSNNYNNYEDCNIIVKVTKGDISANYNTGNTIEFGEYGENKELSDFTLADGWSWVSGSVVPNAGESKHYIVYNPNQALYNDYLLEVNVVVKKATLTGVTHASLETVYDREQKLTDLTLADGWSWVNGDETPLVNKDVYSAVYNKGANYNPYYAGIVVSVQKADVDMSSIIFNSTTVTYDGLAHNIEYSGNLPYGITFIGYSYTSPITQVGTYTCSAYFKQEDTINYNYIDGVIDATLVITKATYDMSGVVFEGKEVTYNGLTHSLECSGNMPSGVYPIYYDNGKVDAGRYVVEVGFEQDDKRNYHLIPPRQATLVINKAQGVISGDESYTYAYNGEERSPTLWLNNTEQELVYESEKEIKEIGEYAIKVYARESTNYLYVEKGVKVIINPTKTSVGSAYRGKLVSLVGNVENNDLGIPQGSALTMEVKSISNQEIVVSVLLGGEALEGDYTVNILKPEGMLGSPQVYLKNGEEYYLLESITENGYITFATPILGEFKLIATEPWDIETQAVLEWWEWLLISLSIVILVGGVVVVVVLYKKGKLPLDKIIAKLRVKKGANNEFEPSSEDGASNEE